MSSRTRTARQIVYFFVGCFTLATLALGGTAYLIASNAVHNQLDAMIESEASGLHQVYAAGGREALERALARRDDRGVNTLGYLLLDARNRRLAGELDTDPAGFGWHDIQFVDLDGQRHDARSLTIALPDQLRLTVAAEVGPVAALEHTMVLLFASGFGIMLVVGLAGGILFGRVIRTRLNTMSVTADAIIAGDLASRVPLSGRDDEFDRLAGTLNRMLDRIDLLVGNVRQVSSDLAHDLRTPITRLRQRLERALAAAAGDPRQTAEIERAIDDVEAVLSLFAALLRIAEVESGALRRFFRPVDLSATVAELALSYAPAAEDQGSRIEFAVEPSIFVLGDVELLSQMLVNLLENALRHTPPGTSIQLRLGLGADRTAELRVEDDGLGVPAAELPRLAQRFTRLERSRSTAGHGLGLNLVSAVALSHGGSLAFEDNDPGLAVIIRLPLAGGEGLGDGAGRRREDEA